MTDNTTDDVPEFFQLMMASAELEVIADFLEDYGWERTATRLRFYSKVVKDIAESAKQLEE